jgi:hypothetical protein
MEIRGHKGNVKFVGFLVVLHDILSLSVTEQFGRTGVN